MIFYFWEKFIFHQSQKRWSLRLWMSNKFYILYFILVEIVSEMNFDKSVSLK